MSTTSSPGYRAPKRNQVPDSSIEIEFKPSDAARDRQFHSSQDGRRAVHRAVNVGPKKRRLHPSELTDTFGDWTPLAADEASLGEEDIVNADGDVTGGKRKRYDSDDPMRLWRPHAAQFLDQLFREEALGDGARCTCCLKSFDAGSRRFRCSQCGPFIQCMECVLSRHELMPFHVLKEWRVCFWDSVTLASLGCVYQLGHGGHPCPHPAPKTRSMVVLDFPYIHTVHYRYCACDLSDRANNLEQLLRNRWYPATTVDPATCATFDTLEVFRGLNVVGNINAHDFVGMMERRTDPCGESSVPDRYKAFSRMARQYAFLKRLKRAGRAHDASGVWGTKTGECAVLCWACPQDNINLPAGWQDVAPEFQFLYMLILAMDANFRLKNRLRPNERDDPPLASGWGYMVEEAPYREHLRNYVPEKDISTCIAFAALLQKETRMTTGLRTSGVGGVVCARHELVRPQGLGNLQKGERYMNMDYILLSSILGVTALYIAVSYDIACQWRVNFPVRMKDMSERLRLDLAITTLLFGLPVWHASAHERSCQVENSLSYQVGVGRTDGEGIERTWSGLNPLAWATKEMNRGSREDAIEDKVDHHNFEKNINQGTTLPRKLIVAINERDRHVTAFTDVDRTLKASLREVWQKRIDDWVVDRTKPNPYELDESKNGQTSEAAIKKLLAKEEEEEAAAGIGKLHGTSAASLLVVGLQLEEQQYRINRELGERPLLVADQNERVAQMRRSFYIKLARFRRLQAVYMPGAVMELEEEEESRDPDLPPLQAEKIKLYLPSGLRPANRAGGCAPGLLVKEARLREGQCSDALRRLRSSLHAKRHLLNYCRRQVVGQRAATRTSLLVDRVSERVDAAATKYRRARGALIALRGAAQCTQWLELKPEDVTLDEEREVDMIARKKLGNIGSNVKPSRRPTFVSSKKKKLSWIWTEGGGPGADEGELIDAVRVEWAKAKARKERWVEEVELTREEMKRVLRFLRWRAVWWESRRRVAREGIADEVREGLEAYAARQAALTRDIGRRFKKIWDTSASTAVRIAAHAEAILGEGMAAFREAEDGGSNGAVLGNDEEGARTGQ